MDKFQAPIYIQIANTLKEDIENEKFTMGSLLPTEEELEKQFNASRTTIRNAIGLLEKQGYVINVLFALSPPNSQITIVIVPIKS